jgi:2-succinyl-5-enolpyruvyl-6-hydroxy-3-cyclohexene-1-carboxylate synthase
MASMYGFDYAIASDELSLEVGIKQIYSSNSKPFILEVFTPTRENDKVLLQFFKELV